MNALLSWAVAAGVATVAAGAAIAVTRVLAWRHANRLPARLEIESGLTEADKQRNADYPLYRELYRNAYGVGVSRRAVLAAAHEVGLVNERYAASKAPWERSWLETAADTSVRVLQPDYEGLDRDSEADADDWIASLERAGRYSVIRGQVALDEAYARLINEEFEAFDRATSEAYERVLAVGSAEIVAWANEWKEFGETHPAEAATVEIQGIREWIDTQLAVDLAATLIAEAEAEMANAPH